jgi:hypothetical protein
MTLKPDPACCQEATEEIRDLLQDEYEEQCLCHSGGPCPQHPEKETNALLTIGDVILLKSFKCYFPDVPSSRVQLEWATFNPSTKKHKFAAIFMGEQVDDNPIDPEKFLNVLGWERKPVNSTTKYKVGESVEDAGSTHDTLEEAQKDLEAVERLTPGPEVLQHRPVCVVAGTRFSKSQLRRSNHDISYHSSGERYARRPTLHCSTNSRGC